MSRTDSNKLPSILVLGAGNFGTCLAQHLALKGHSVTLWANEPDVAQKINQSHKNPNYLSSVILSKRIGATNKISEKIVHSHEAILMVVPTQALREVLGRFKRYIAADMLIICAAKGIEMNTLALPQQIIAQVLGKSFADQACFLSGPSFAQEVIEQQPTAVSMASHDEQRCIQAQNLFHTELFRVYRSNDPVGLEVAGALKNVIAIAAGAVAGLGFKNNARAALVTRGLAEITRVGVALGANPLTFTGLGGIGDLMLTCNSELSRNFKVGYRIGAGEPVSDVLSSTESVAEGVYTTKAVYELSRRLNVSTPISEQVYHVLYENRPIAEAVEALMTREPKAELAVHSPKVLAQGVIR